MLQRPWVSRRYSLRENKFVTRNCIECERARTLAFWDIPKVTCPQCYKPNEVGIVNKNYGFRCCGRVVELGSLVPFYDDAGFKA
jgi:hypothetical protein